MKASELVAKMLAQRESWVDLDPGKRMRIRRPDETTATRLMREFKPADSIACCVGWEGITEADLLGADVGSSDPAEFSADLCSVVLLDHVEWQAKVTDGVTAAFLDHLKKKADAAKN